MESGILSFLRHDREGPSFHPNSRVVVVGNTTLLYIHHIKKTRKMKEPFPLQTQNTSMKIKFSILLQENGGRKRILGPFPSHWLEDLTQNFQNQPVKYVPPTCKKVNKDH